MTDTVPAPEGRTPLTDYPDKPTPWAKPFLGQRFVASHGASATEVEYAFCTGVKEYTNGSWVAVLTTGFRPPYRFSSGEMWKDRSQFWPVPAAEQPFQPSAGMAEALAGLEAFETRLAALTARLGDLENSITVVESSFGNIADTLESHGTRVSAVEARPEAPLDVISSALAGLDKRVGALEGFLPPKSVETAKTKRG